MKIFLMMILLLLPLASFAKNEAKPIDKTALEQEPKFLVKKIQSLGDCAKLGKNLASCKKYSCKMPHPEVESFMVEHEIKGFVGDDLSCWHVQTVPGADPENKDDVGVIDCRYNKKIRKLMAKQFSSDVKILNADESFEISKSFPVMCKVIE